MTIPHSPDYLFSDDRTGLVVDETDPLPPYSKDPVFHDMPSQTSGSKLSWRRLYVNTLLTSVIAMHDIGHDPRVRQEVTTANFSDDEDESVDESLPDAPAPPYSLYDILALN